MSELFFFLAVGLAFLFLLILWFLRSGRNSIDIRVLLETEEAFTAFRQEVPPQALKQKIFSQPDWEFFLIEAPSQIRRVFLQRRKAIALSWLRQIRKRASQLMRLHRRMVSANIRLSPTIEAKLAINYFVFLLLCNSLSALIWLGGPFWVGGIVRYTTTFADQLSHIFGRLLATLDPSYLNENRAD